MMGATGILLRWQLRPAPVTNWEIQRGLHRESRDDAAFNHTSSKRSGVVIL